MNVTRLNYIDAWRAIAVALVIVSHLNHNIYIAAALNAVGASSAASYGHLGVFIFFFISGYVVSHVCLKEVAQSRAFSVTGFYIRRAYRIAPPLIIYLATCLLLGQAGIIEFSINEFIGSALYLCNSAQQFIPCGWYAGHTWSLAFEEQFYLLFPTLFTATELGRRIHPAAVFAVALALVPLVLPISWIGRTGFVTIHALFGVGYCCAKYENQLIKIISHAPMWLLILSSLVTFFPATAFDSATIGKYYKFAYIASIPLMIVASSLVSGIIGKILNSKALSYIGRISYSIYLWQQLATSPVFHGSTPTVQVSAIVLVVLLCAFSFRFIERPLMDFGRRRSTAGYVFRPAKTIRRDASQR